MTDTAPIRHPTLYLLCDHLDAALAMGEDLLTERVVLAEAEQKLNMARLVRQSSEVADFLQVVRTLELSLIARLLHARKRAEEIKRTEVRLKPLVALYVGVTAVLVDAAEEMGDTTMQAFATGDTALAFLRSRGVIARDAAGLEQMTQLVVTEDYLVAERIRLGTLMDMVATFLDTLDTMFDLYGEDAAAEPVTAPETAPVEVQETIAAAEPAAT